MRTHQQRTFWILLPLLLAGWGSVAQTIWPGDINNNGEVTVVDVVYWGVAAGQTGPPRPGATTDWSGQAIGLPWSQNFPNGVNYAFADADGNGIVDDNDIDDGVEDNYGLQHGVVTGDGYLNGTPGSDPGLELLPVAGVYGTGVPIEIDLRLGDPTLPIDAFYGVAVRLSYATAKGSEAGELEFQVADAPWYDPTKNNSFDFYVEDEDAGTAALAITRTDQQTVSGEGVLGRFSVVIEDIIANESVDTLTVRIDSIYLVAEDLTPRAVAPYQTRVIIARDPGSVTAAADLPPRPAPALRVFPNPTTDFCRVRTREAVLDWQLVAMTGRSYALSVLNTAATAYELRFPAGLPPGSYVLRARTARGVLQQRIIISPS